MSRGRDALFVPDDIAIVAEDVTDSAPPSEPVVREERAEVRDRGDRADNCDGAEAPAVEEFLDRRNGPRRCVECRDPAPENFSVTQSDHNNNNQKDSTVCLAEGKEEHRDRAAGQSGDREVGWFDKSG